MAAVQKARELIEKYQFDMGAEELKREGFIQEYIEMESSRFVFARRILDGIEKFCEVETAEWFHRDIWILGLASDVELAVYLIESLTTFAVAGADLHVAAERKMHIALGIPLESQESREMRRSYLIGCAKRIRERLREMWQERRSPKYRESHGALVNLDKPALVQAEMERLGIKLRRGSGLVGAGSSRAAAAGSARGDKATFGRPVAGGHVSGFIGRK